MINMTQSMEPPRMDVARGTIRPGSGIPSIGEDHSSPAGMPMTRSGCRIEIRLAT
jgi:hypothetical protein